MNNVNVVYTPWSNLKKTADMDVGQIGFHRQKDVSVHATTGGGARLQPDCDVPKGVTLGEESPRLAPLR